MDSANEKPNTILVVDDDRTVLKSVVNLLQSAKYNCLTATDKDQALDVIRRERPPVVLTDIKMKGENDGLRVLEEAKNTDPDIVVLLYTGYGTVPNAVEAFKKGAFDFIQKFNTHHDLLLPVERAFKFAHVQRENVYLRSRLDLTNDGVFYGAIGTSPIMLRLFEKAKRIAQSTATVLIVGETGTGKEILSRGIHHYSPRCNESFIPVAVGTLPETMLEDELFGHVKGAFTGANIEKPGLFEAADQGTIFLDEIGEVSFDLQHKLLRVLQEKTVRRLGSVKERSIDVRIVSATNRDPEELVKEGRMREDLYFRLNVIQLRIPPLRERKEDIPALVYHFLRQHRDIGIIEVEKVDPQVLLALQDYKWPGNVRELQYLMLGMIAEATHPVIRLEDLPKKFRPSSAIISTESHVELKFKEAKARIIETFERDYLEKMLKLYDYNITVVAKKAGLNRKTIYRLAEARGISLHKPGQAE
ncbi:MAG TPA: sigma-54 dependent transcriptional regulator [bacterium]|nr:sigma-54 dependent transcriptional regulator [bacterium]HNT64593.1 sigma-54 dependent transcriptional regulator [bacterium]HOX84564.1 sigma-54 dependent transcriptional regulator [bacterium]HPG45287.1 sigma-54 dependent transcriptional regulator [bacterium]HPM98994.1 sigma-54 dependent transcriptional regulator [bacterium]